LEAKKITGRINHEDADVVKTYAGDLKGLPAESNIAETKTYLRFFVKRIEIDRNQAVIK
jgi:hypothetical protein